MKEAVECTIRIEEVIEYITAVAAGVVIEEEEYEFILHRTVHKKQYSIKDWRDGTT